MDLNKENTSIIIGRIIARSIAGTITPAEQAVLDDWLQDEKHRQVYTAVCNGQSIHDALSEFEGFSVKEGYQRFQASVHKGNGIRFRGWMVAAAAILMFVAVSVAVYVIIGEGDQHTTLTAANDHDIAPGGNRATLTLADGRTITLDESRDGIVIGSGEITYTDGNLLADVNGDEQSKDQEPLLELRTPKGGTYQVMLPDGTRVWLNAASTLKYPSRFSGPERVVELVGEAYFAVAKDKKQPFRVISDRQEIEVLGTEFNVSAYPGDLETKTTLVEGKVRLAMAEKKEYIELIPGEQAIVQGENITKAAVDTGLYTAWKSGYFYFKRTSLEEILRQAARWYDVEVVYQGGVPRETFSGDIKRNVSLRGLLDILQHSTINVTLEDRTLIVRQ